MADMLLSREHSCDIGLSQSIIFTWHGFASHVPWDSSFCYLLLWKVKTAGLPGMFNVGIWEASGVLGWSLWCNCELIYIKCTQTSLFVIWPECYAYTWSLSVFGLLLVFSTTLFSSHALYHQLGFGNAVEYHLLGFFQIETWIQQCHGYHSRLVWQLFFFCCLVFGRFY